MIDLKTYYIAALLPLVAILVLFYYEYNYSAVSVFVLYSFLYRTHIDSSRLLMLGIIDDNCHKKWVIPFDPSWGYVFSQFSALYLEKIKKKTRLF